MSDELSPQDRRIYTIVENEVKRQVEAMRVSLRAEILHEVQIKLGGIRVDVIYDDTHGQP